MRNDAIEAQSASAKAKEGASVSRAEGSGEERVQEGQ